MNIYLENLKNAETLETLKTVVESINNATFDNAEFVFPITKIEEKTRDFTLANKTEYINNFVYAVEKDRKSAFDSLLAKPYYIGYSVILDNKKFSIKENKILFKFADLEKAFQIKKHTETNKKGDPIRNTSVTIFNALRFYGLMSVFIRNLQKVNFEVDTEKGYNLDNVVIDSEKVFKNDEGKAFASNSNNALEKQLNILVKFYGYDVKMLKKDLPILRLKAQKIKQCKESAKFTVDAIIDDNSILKFADVIFGVVASRIKDNDIEVITSKPEKE